MSKSTLRPRSFSIRPFVPLRHLIDASEGYTLVPETFARTLPRPVRQRQLRPFAERVPTREVSLVRHRQSWKLGIFEALAAALGRNMPRALQRELADEEVMPIRVERR